MKNTFYALCFIIVSTMFFSCKKYPEGPTVSIYTKMHRAKGEWDVEHYSVNGVDSTEFLKNNPNYGTYLLDYRKHYDSFQYKVLSNSSRYSGRWWFTNNCKSIYFNLGSLSFSIPPYTANAVIWEIRRLTEKQMWLKTNYNNKEYYIKFKLLRNI